MQLACNETLLIIAPFVGPVPEHQPGGNSLAAEHQCQGRRKVLAVTLGVLCNEVFNRIYREIALDPLQTILESVRTAKLVLQVPSATDKIVGRRVEIA